MAAYKFTSVKQLQGLLNNVEEIQKKDIHSYAGGHLNEMKLYKPQNWFDGTKWKTSKKRPIPGLDATKLKSQPRVRSGELEEKRMKDVLYDFSVGTTGSVPVTSPRKHQTPPRRSKLAEFKKEAQTQKDTQARVDSPGASSVKSLYTQLDDGVLIEELKPQEMMMPSPRLRLEGLNGASKKSATSDDYDIMDDLTQTLDRDGYLTFRHTFLPSHTVGVTKTDQFNKMMDFQSGVLRKQDSEEKQVLSGVKAVEHLERRLEEDLEVMHLGGIGPNFHKLQVFSNIFEDLIEETPTFGYILKCIKAEYDNYITKLLDSQTPQHSRLLRDQVEQMSLRGTSKPRDLQEVKLAVNNLEEEARRMLEVNQRLRREVEEEEEWLANAPEPDPPQMSVKAVKALDAPTELADEIEHSKALILEKLDALNGLRTKLREQFVPLTVCTHLEQCIKETEIEVQKLLKQNEYFERSNAEMESDLHDAIQDADTSERDARRIWRKVNSLKGLPVVHLKPREGNPEDSDEDEDDETKWNWYIS